MTSDSLAQSLNPDIRYCIQLANKYTGETIHLGTMFKTREDAQVYADKDCCSRCNYIHIVMVSGDKEWGGKHRGFVNQKHQKR